MMMRISVQGLTVVLVDTLVVTRGGAYRVMAQDEQGSWWQYRDVLTSDEADSIEAGVIAHPAQCADRWCSQS